MKKVLIYGLLLLVIVAAFGVPYVVEDQMNVVQRDNVWPVTERARNLHATLRIADLHADTLLWSRDFDDASSIGHVDLPRLIEGGVTLQVLAAVTKSPAGQNYESNATDTRDNITLLTVAQRWPVRTWGSLLERALYQSERLHEIEAANDQLVIIRSAADLDGHLAASADRVAALLAAEGAHPLEGDIDNLERLWNAGYRMLGLHHFFDNRLGGSLHGQSGAGLTPFGQEVVATAVDMGFIIDVAHSSPAVVDDVLALSDKPVVVSHTGIHGTCASPRNIADEQMQRIAAAGGLVGIGYWDAVCDITPRGVARTIAYAVDLLGDDHVALGSDFDGSTTVTFDTAELAVLTQALLDAELDEATVRKVMGENQLAFLTKHLPAD